MEGLSQNEKIIWSCWESKANRDVAREAAAKGTHVNLCIKYLMTKNDLTEDAAKDWFLAEVKSWTVQLLLRKQIFKVLHILNKVNINTETHLIDIATEAKSIEFRDFIADHLIKISSNIKPENSEKWLEFHRHWCLLKYLENSFQSEGTFKQNKVFGLSEDRVFVTETEIKDMSIEKIIKYPEHWKRKVATALFFDVFEFVLLDFSSPTEMWNHLLECNKAMVLVRWINMQMSEVVRDMNARYNFFINERFAKSLFLVDIKEPCGDTIKKLDEIFRNWQISKEMILQVSKSSCFAYTKLCVYDTLCSYGIVPEWEQKDLPSIISRFARTQNLKLVDDIFTESCSTMTRREFYLEFAKYCVQNRLYKVLTICFEGDVLGNNFDDIEDEYERECIKLWLSFKSIEHTADRQSHVVPVYKTCEQIARGDVNNYILDNPYLILGMILLEDGAKLFNVFSKEDYLKFKDFELPNRNYKDKLPHLYSVNQKYKEVNEVDANDLNVYQLLSDYRGLDVSKIFEFQLFNYNKTRHLREDKDKSDRRSLGSLISTIVEIDKNDMSKKQNPVEMPHFANEKLMRRYGYVAKLNHIYYLKQYRPCHASQAFVAQQYQLYNRLQDKGIKSACCEAHALALQNWNDRAMAACAVSFVAMIGCNPTRCRVHMSAAKTIYDHMTNTKGLSSDVAAKVVSDYVSKLLVGNDVTAREVLHYLEEVTLYEIKNQSKNGKYDINLVLYESQPMVKFALLHNLPLPEALLQTFIKRNSWFDFLLFGDVFRYPMAQMLQLTQLFENRCYAEHLRHIIMFRNAEESLDKDLKSAPGSGRRISRLNSVDPSPISPTAFEFPEVLNSSAELWEVVAACHGPEDPPGALLRAAPLYAEPLLPLIATCYEPNAVGVLWAHWVLTSLGEAIPKDVKSRIQLDISQQNPSDSEFQTVMEICLQAGYIRTLHESVMVFFPESSLCTLTAFLCRCIWQKNFDSETTKLIHTFTKHCQRKYSMDNGLPWPLSREGLHRISISLVNIALSQSFDSALHQKLFLKCIIDTQFGKEFCASVPDYSVIYDILKVSMKTSSTILIGNLLREDKDKYLSDCIVKYINNKNYDVALKIGKLAKLPVNDILTAEWSDKKDLLHNSEEALNDEDWTYFTAQCSEAFKGANVNFDVALEFLSNIVSNINDNIQKYYSYKIILSWFHEQKQYGSKREDIEHLMWDSYFKAEMQSEIFLNNYQSTLYFILDRQKDQNAANKMGLLYSDKPFSDVLEDIEKGADIGQIEKVVAVNDVELIDSLTQTLSKLLSLKLMIDAFRLASLYRPSNEIQKISPCPVTVVRTCMRLAERKLTPFAIPQELKLIISATTMLSNLSNSDTSETSFEELVVINDKQDNAQEGTVHLAAKEDADRLSALEALAARNHIVVAKQVASYFRISLQLGWDYVKVLKYQNNPLELISFVSGRSKMPLANIVFRTYNVSTKEISEYLCQEMVSAIIYPHLQKASSFRQKEHFQYTLWGYALNSDMEMFLNMRPDSCTQLGRLILEHLMAFRKIYNTTTVIDTDGTSSLDVETLIDEEYQYVDESEVESLTKSSTTDGGTIVSGESEMSQSTVYSYGKKLSKECRRNIFDVISKSNAHIRYEVKSNVRKITKGAKLSNKQVNIISIELLVLAHECFSSACDTEGVAVVLRSAQALTSQLQAARSWRLMVRLLTGLARYTEMAYVFQTLRDNHQFEFLLGQFDYVLGQQQDKITEFKQGLLDFLKNHCPGDTESYIMVALHFNMYAEAAAIKKKQALNLIDDLENIALESGKRTKKASEWLVIHDNNNTRSILDTALNHCVDASELFLQGGCLGFAGEMADLAKQIALQISLLDASPTRLVLNRSSELTYRLVSEYLNFMEGLVLMVGRGGSQWRELAYRRALTNDQVYLRDMVAYRPDVAADVLTRYKSETKTTKVSQAAMTELRNLCR